MIVVSRSAATLTYLDADNNPRFTTYVSLGRAGVDTPEGEYSISLAREGFESRVVVATVRVGRTTDVDVVLERR